MDWRPNGKIIIKQSTCIIHLHFSVLNLHCALYKQYILDVQTYKRYYCHLQAEWKTAVFKNRRLETHLLVHHRGGERVHLDGNKWGISVEVASRSSIQLRTISNGPYHVEQGDVGAVELVGNQGGRSRDIRDTSSPWINTEPGAAEHILELFGHEGGALLDPCTHREKCHFHPQEEVEELYTCQRTINKDLDVLKIKKD